MVYSEHMLEHMPPQAGAHFLRECWRVLAPGGVLRVVTPDVAKYACALVHGDADGFLKRHAARFPPMEAFGSPPSATTMLNNIVRNYGHEWIYSPDEFRRAVRAAGLPAGSACVSDRAGRGLPVWAATALRRANAPRKAAHKCWLDQEVRADESMYVVLTKS